MVQYLWCPGGAHLTNREIGDSQTPLNKPGGKPPKIWLRPAAMLVIANGVVALHGLCESKNAHGLQQGRW